MPYDANRGWVEPGADDVGGGNVNVPEEWAWQPASTVGTSTDTTGTLTFTVPTETQAGDLIVIAVGTRNSSLGSPSGVSGWTTIYNGDTGSDERTAAWAKIADGTEAGATVTLSCSGPATGGGLTVIRRDDGEPYTSFEVTGAVDKGNFSTPTIAANAGDLWVGVWSGCYDGIVTQNTIGAVYDLGYFTKGAFAQYTAGSGDGWGSCQYHPVIKDQTFPAITHSGNSGQYASAGCLVAR
jgi:hypothetical protein